MSGTLLLLSCLSGLTAAADGPPSADEWLTRPVDDGTFGTFLDFLAYDSHLPFEEHAIDVEEKEDIRIEHFSFQSTPGVRVFGRLYQPLVPVVPKSPAIILLHGGEARGKDSATPRALAELLARVGWTVLDIDMQYFGERSTELLTTFTEKDKHDRLYNRPSVYLAWITQTVKDVRRSFDFLLQERNIDPQRVALLGYSRGAQVGAIVGGVERRLVAVVLLHGGHFDRMENGHLPAACPANYIGRISPRPLLTINGNHDTDYVKETSVLPLYRLAKPPKLIRWADTGHGGLTDKDRAAMVQWLKIQLE